MVNVDVDIFAISLVNNEELNPQDISALSDFDSDFNEIDWVNSLFKDVAKTEKEVRKFCRCHETSKFIVNFIENR